MLFLKHWLNSKNTLQTYNYIVCTTYLHLYLLYIYFIKAH